MVVTPLRDGMNLVGKEYVATRRDLDGVLVLSEFAGAAAELTSALLVNPHDLDSVTHALERALTMEPEEERTRMRTMHRQVMTHDVDRWARSFLDFLDPATEEASSLIGTDEHQHGPVDRPVGHRLLTVPAIASRAQKFIDPCDRHPSVTPAGAV